MYTPKDNSWDVKTVQEAIDELKNDHKAISISDQSMRCSGEVYSCTISDFVKDNYYMCIVTDRNQNYVNISGEYEILYSYNQPAYLDGRDAEVYFIQALSTSLTFATQSSGMDVQCRNIY